MKFILYYRAENRADKDVLLAFVDEPMDADSTATTSPAPAEKGEKAPAEKGG